MRQFHKRRWRWNYKRPAALLMAVIVLFFGYTSLASSEANEGLQFKEVVVQPGESLWQIAKDVAGPKQDVRESVDEIMTYNNLKSSQIAAGQVLRIPVR